MIDHLANKIFPFSIAIVGFKKNRVIASFSEVFEALPYQTHFTGNLGQIVRKSVDLALTYSGHP